MEKLNDIVHTSWTVSQAFVCTFTLITWTSQSKMTFCLAWEDRNFPLQFIFLLL